MAGNYDKYGNYDFSMFEPKPVSFDHNAARKIATLPGVGERTADSGMRLVTRKKKTTVEAKNEMRATALRAAKVLTVAAVLLSLFAALLTASCVWTSLTVKSPRLSQILRRRRPRPSDLICSSIRQYLLKRSMIMHKMFSEW